MSDELQFRFVHRRGLFSLEVEGRFGANAVNGLYGPSGSGKTTLLRCLAGLEPQVRGEVRFNGDVWQDEAGCFVPPHRRQVAMVFQQGALFAHLDVRGNLEYGLKRTPVAERRLGFDEVVDALGLGHLLARGTPRLSGGEVQRVAIGRALLASPRLLLLDEPVAALDRRSKQEIFPYLRELFRAFHLPVVYVTHDMQELSRFASRLTLMEAGKIIVQGEIHELLARLDLPIAGEESAGALIDGEVAGYDSRYLLNEIRFSGGVLWAAGEDRGKGTQVRLRIRARDVSLALHRSEDSSVQNIVAAEVAALARLANGRTLVRLVVGDTALLSRITWRAQDELRLEPGKRVFAEIKSVALHV
ncbi:MAG: molybdenum ABC transporter ATP-binding protein [Chromatiales bacterium]|nr:molybdenum ABC transporter ATP-binding protein [Chromatiales bacterium]